MRAAKYAVVMLLVMAQLAGTSAAGQQIAAASSSRDCPTDVPDSLEISWTRPCYEHDWVLDPRFGCQIGDWHPAVEDRATWSGSCQGGKKEGKGVVQWYEHGRTIDRFEGTFRDGKREGFGRYVWTQDVSYEGHYAGDLPHGAGTATLFGETYAGTWNNGCLTVRGRVVAIGVERSSCGRPARTAQKTSL
jgi:hypothetical protein